MQGDGLFSSPLIAQRPTRLVLRLDIMRSIHGFPRIQIACQNPPFRRPENCVKRLPSPLRALSLPSFAKVSLNDVIPCFSVLFQDRDGKTNFCNPSQFQAENHLFHFDILTEARKRLFCAVLCGLLSRREELNEHKVFYTLSFESSTELRGALLRVLSQSHPQKDACLL